MLTPSQYAAVGRLALSFNEIEYAFEVYIAYLLGAPNWGISVLLAEEGMFRQKAERFDKILDAISKESDILFAQITPIRQWVKRAKQLAEHRNQYVHALAVHDFGTNVTRLRMRGTEREFDEAEINNLAAEAAVLVGQLHTHCGDLLVMIEDVRGAK